LSEQKLILKAKPIELKVRARDPKLYLKGRGVG
jgi:hypothetical protein